MSEYEKGAALMLVASASDEYGDSERKYCGALSAIYHRLHDGREMDLRPGMLVQWKPNLKNRKSPEYGKPAIVIEMLSPPVIDGPFDSGSTYFREQIGRTSCRERGCQSVKISV